MKPIKYFPQEKSSAINYLLTDIDDTITHEGRIPASAFQALEDFSNADIKVIPITGRPAGWCDHIARMWPVDGIVGENGAFYFVYDFHAKKMIRRYFKTAQERARDQIKLTTIKQKIIESVPGCVVSADQPYREADLAIDFAEDVPALSQTEIDKIVHIFEKNGASAKVSSIHVNGWFGAYDKLSMTKLMFREVFKIDLDTIKENVIFAGDSPNDEPMFEYFPNAVGVANVLAFQNSLVFKPAWITREKGGAGFAELAKILLP
ncbi:MAG: HAD family hydrolase [Desulfobulbaceae bacterium S3730MH12]|nr:MAG: HAD family hydrolase [Desulfobulbaceae bacterium S5133MH15]OEU55047.1 MAG: HAD family hydrolase [Desulfobulbaceae bacterium S3730MH12]OEU81868.1 MAG: HAD family hydrolase [Desulfobulbaceae bacterium C00003063]